MATLVETAQRLRSYSLRSARMRPLIPTTPGRHGFGPRCKARQQVHELSPARPGTAQEGFGFSVPHSAESPSRSIGTASGSCNHGGDVLALSNSSTGNPSRTHSGTVTKYRSTVPASYTACHSHGQPDRRSGDKMR